MHEKVLAGSISVLTGIMACSRQDSQQTTNAPPTQGDKETITRSLEGADSSVTGTRRPTFTAADWDRAAAAIVKLQPRNFRGLPPAIVGELERRGCTIPQTYVPGGLAGGSPVPTNLIGLSSVLATRDPQFSFFATQRAMTLRRLLPPRTADSCKGWAVA